ncbi:MAG: class I SAM-dependent methyltransferase [Mycobacterium sp.]|nr:class I SAM-dependent methyltransferase [Mycobacterium sp.]
MRSEWDTWDITTSVGSTALFVADARALEARKPDPVAVDEYAESFCYAAGGRWADVLDGKDPDNNLMTEFGIHFINYQGARTKYFDEFLMAAARAGVRQMVILAAGLDSRAYRLDWPEGTVVYELDLPRVLEFKHDVLEQRGDRPRVERVPIACDLRDDWQKALRDNGFDPGRPAAFLAEGLLIYLPATGQAALFEGIDTLSAPGSFVGLEEGEPMPEPVWEAAKAAERAAGDSGNLFFQLIYNEQVAPAARWFGDRGWDATPTPLGDYLREVGRPVPGPESEAFGMVRTNTLVTATKRGLPDH